MTHTVSNLASLLIDALTLSFARKEPDIYKMAKEIQHAEYPNETVEYVASMLREGRWND